jgi:spore germination protein KC
MVVKEKEENNRKRIKSLLLFFLISILFLSGCWDRTEVNDLSIVTAVAIDKSDDKQIEVTVQVFIPKALSAGGGQGGGSGGGGGQVVSIAGHVGSNIADALSKLQGKLPRKLFWGQTKVFIFGEKLAEEGIQEHMDFLERIPQIKGNAFVYVSEGDAKSLLEVPANLEPYSSEVIRALTDMNIGVKTTIKDLDIMLTGINQAAALPYARIGSQKKTTGEPIPYVHIDGSAVFQKDKMVGKITEEETRGLLWLRDEIENATVSIKIEGEEGLVSIHPVSSSVKLHPQIKNGTWKMVVKVRTEGSIIQNGTKQNISKTTTVKKIEKAFKEEIQGRMKLALEKVQHEFKADVTNFAKEFYRKYPKQMRQVKREWNEKYPEVEVVFEIRTNINHEGDISQPAGLPTEEVKEN